MPTEHLGLVFDGSAGRNKKLSRTLVSKWIIALWRRTVEQLAFSFRDKRVGA